MAESRNLRQAFALLVVPVLLFTAGPTMAGTMAGSPLDPPGLGVSVDVVRDKTDTTRFTCTAEVSNLATGEVLAAPRIIFRSDAPTTARTRWQDDDGKADREIVVEVSAQRTGTSISYTVTELRNGKTVAVQKGSLTLR